MKPPILPINIRDILYEAITINRSEQSAVEALVNALVEKINEIIPVVNELKDNQK